MADCVNLQLERVSARIEVGGFLYTTPGRAENTSGDVMSFSLNKSRGQATAKLQCQLIANVADQDAINTFSNVEDNLGEVIIMWAGPSDNIYEIPRLFTGYITSVRPTPHWNDARKQILDIQAEDVFAKMVYGPKFSRRFKIQDDPFAVITGGKRNQGGSMTQLRRVKPGQNGVSYIFTGGSGQGFEHSPLIKTPDYVSRTPNGVSPGYGKSSLGSETGMYRMEPAEATVYPGAIVSSQVINAKTGEIVSVAGLESTAGKACMCHAKPSTKSFETGQVSKSGLEPGVKSFPLWFDYGNNDTLNFYITGSYSPIQVTFVHPLDGGTASIEFKMVPPHTHRDLGQGGPAVAVFDAFPI